MANQLTTPIPIRAAKGIIYAKSTAVTIDNSTTIISEFTAATDIQCIIKDLTITPPKGEIGKIDLIGETASALEPEFTFQNYLLEEKSFEFAKLSGTLLFQQDESPFDTMSSGAGIAEPTNYHRYQIGASDSGKTRKVGAVALHILGAVAATDIKTILFNNCYIMLGDIKATGADGHLEQDFELVCAPENYLEEVRD